MSDILQRLTLGMGLSIELAILVKATLLLELALYASESSSERARRFALSSSPPRLACCWCCPCSRCCCRPFRFPCACRSCSRRTDSASGDSRRGRDDGRPERVTSHRAWPIAGRGTAVESRMGRGCIALLFPLAIACWRLGRLRRRASRWLEGEALAETLAASAGIHKHMDVLRHEGAMVPMTSGFARPMIVMPADIQAWSPADVRRAIVHEVEQCVVPTGRCSSWPGSSARCTGFIHVSGWRGAGSALSQSARATMPCSVARSMRTMPSNSFDSPSGSRIRPEAAILAMTSRSDLSTRVSAVLDDCQVRGRAGALRTGAVAAVAAVLVLAISPLKAVERSATGDAYTVLRANESARRQRRASGVRPRIRQAEHDRR